jgi:hypothetical protein
LCCRSSIADREREGDEVIIRRSNIPKVSDLRPIPAFHATAWMEFPSNRRLASVTLALAQGDLSQFLLHDVIIDGAKYFCVDVHTFAPGPL